MKSKYIVLWTALLIVTQACSPTREPPHPAPLPEKTENTQPDISVPIVETTLPQRVIEVTLEVITAVAVSTSQPLSLPLATETSLPGGNIIPEEGITLQDRGKTFNMKVGDSFLLNLGAETFDWTVSVDNENVLRMKMGVMVLQGAQGIYEALSPGIATLTATGNPLCAQSTPPCMMPSILFSVTVIVE